jgi:hypothetical protein
VLFIVKAFLREYYSNDSIKSVYFKEILTVEVVVYKEGGLSKYTIERFKYLDVFIIEGELVVYLYKLGE